MIDFLHFWPKSVFYCALCNNKILARATGESPTVRIVLPFKDQDSADFVRKQLNDLSHKTRTVIQPVFVSNKIEQKLKVQEKKPPLVNQQCVVYRFQCDLCDASYVGYTLRHLHQRVDEHKNKTSSIGKHFRDTVLSQKTSTNSFMSSRNARLSLIV